MIDAVVLAGGLGRRFGGDKLTADLDGRPVVRHALEACDEVAERLVLVLAPDASVPALPEPLAGRVVVARDPVAHGGPLAGLAAALEVEGLGDLVVVAGGDMPAMVPGVLRMLAGRLAEDPTSRAITLEAEPPSPLPMAIRARAALPAARALLADDRRSLQALLDRLRSGVVPAGAWRALDPDGRTLSDIDVPADLRALRQAR